MKKQRSEIDDLELKADKKAFENIFSTIDGKRVLRLLYRDCTSMMGEYEADHCKASFNEGRRYMLRQILNYAKPVENGEFSDVTLEFFEELTNWSR